MSARDIVPMQDRWRGLCRRIECAPAARRFSELDALYSESHRAYHTWTHIRECLDVWDRSPQDAGDPEALEFAIWLHDAVYRPLRPGNEEESAALASKWLEQCPSAVIDEGVVTGLILATRHPIDPKTRDQALLQDIDLHVLGASAERYAEYEEQVREEYRLVPGPLFRRRRAQLLEELLRPQFLFHTEWFREQFEAAARRNLEHTLAELK